MQLKKLGDWVGTISSVILAGFGIIGFIACVWSFAITPIRNDIEHLIQQQDDLKAQINERITEINRGFEGRRRR